jgi:hypothetical protein
MVLREVFWPKSDGTTREWKKLQSRLGVFVISIPHHIFFRVIKSRRRWAGYVARMGRGEESSAKAFGRET